MKSVEEIEATIGIIGGRDGIHMDTLSFIAEERVVQVQGEINCELCSKKHDATWLKFLLSFKWVKSYNVYDPEVFAYISPYKSNIAENRHSDLLKKRLLKGKGYSHFFILTYDFNIEIISREIFMKILDKR